MKLRSINGNFLFHIFYHLLRFLIKKRKYKIAQIICKNLVNKKSSEFFSIYSKLSIEISDLTDKNRNNLSRLLIMLGEIEYGCSFSVVMETDRFFEVIETTGLDQPDMAAADQKVFASSLDGKSMCIVGPVSRGNVTAAIKQYDLVGRLGFSGPDSCAAGTGTRTDFSFYAEHKLKAMKERGLLAQVSILDFAIVKNPDFDQHTKDLSDKSKIVKSIVSKENYRELLGFHPNATQDLIIHLINLGITKIMVMNLDMFLTPVYPAGYIANREDSILQKTAAGWSLPRLEMARAFGNHNPLAHFRFMVDLLERGYIEVDEELLRILKMEETEYIKCMDETYGVSFLN